MKLKLFILLSFIFLSECGIAQKYFEKQGVVSASPQVAALEKFTDYPVSLYTGVPEISIPVHVIKLKGLNFPISLSYHSSGIKVDDIASNVGLGWSLSAGGMVSIQANGLMDEVSGFGYQHAQFNKVKNLSLQTSYSPPTVDCNSIIIAEDLLYLYTGGDIQYLRDINFAMDDSEPDMYSFSTPIKSGKFFQDQGGDFRTIPYSKVKIERKLSGNTILGYEITDEDGTIYQFLRLEESQVNTYNNCASPLNSPPAWKGAGRNYNLTKIITVFGEEISLYYTTVASTQTLQNQFNRSRFLNPFSDCWQYNNFNNLYSTNCTTTSYMNYGEARIDSIKSTDGTNVYFNYASQNRTDLTSEKALKQILVKSVYDNSTFKKFDLAQHYWSSRLTLDSVRENGKPAYYFHYDTLYPLPSRLSYSQDHWGYFNNKSNTTLLPIDEFNGFLDGANRDPDSTFTKAGILKKMFYPTGGHTEYFYEPNDYYVSQTTYKPVFVHGASLFSQPDQTVSTSFTIPENTTGHYLVYENTYDGTTIHNDYCYIKLSGPNGFFQQYVGTNQRKYITLSPGNYTLQIENVGSSYSANMQVKWWRQDTIAPHNETGGGIRIKEIKAQDAVTNVAISKKFEYKIPGTSNSSGVAMLHPIYLEIQDDTKLIPATTCNANGGSISCQSLSQNSNSLAPLNFSNGYYVAYTDVSEYMKDKTENGYTHNKFVISNASSASGPAVPPYASPIVYDWLNGTLLEKTTYRYSTSSYVPVTKIKNYYNYTSFNKDDTSAVNLKVAIGAKVGMLNYPQTFGRCNIGCYNDVLSSIQFGVAQFKLYSSWHYLTKTEETQYQSSSVFGMNTTEYFYENAAHIRPTKIVTSNSKGEKISTNIKYPLDYTNLSGNDDYSNGVNNLKNKNVIGSDIEQTITISNQNNSNARVVSANFKVYHPVFPAIKLLKSIEINSGITDFTPSNVSSGTISIDSRYKNQGRIAYNLQGNIREQYKENDHFISYIWDYNNNYPIAEVLNSDSTSIAYTSFESDGTGTWSGINSANIQSTGGITGYKYYSQTGFSFSKSGLNSSKHYLVSYWSKNGSYTLTGNQSGYPKTHRVITIGGVTWTSYEHLVTGQSTITITGTGSIDELRLHPKAAMMNTYCYNPLVGISTACDPAGRISYFEYDGSGRLKLVRDENKYILKKYEYKYITQ